MQSKLTETRKIPKYLHEVPITELKLKASIEYRLQRADIFTLGDLDKCPDYYLNNYVYRIGVGSIKAINLAVREYVKKYKKFKDSASLIPEIDEENLVVRFTKILQIYKQNPKIIDDLDNLINKHKE